MMGSSRTVTTRKFPEVEKDSQLSTVTATSYQTFEPIGPNVTFAKRRLLTTEGSVSISIRYADAGENHHVLHSSMMTPSAAIPLNIRVSKAMRLSVLGVA